MARITKALKVVNEENVVTILTMWGYSEESAKTKVDAGYDLAIKALPNDDAKGIATYVSFY